MELENGALPDQEVKAEGAPDQEPEKEPESDDPRLVLAKRVREALEYHVRETLFLSFNPFKRRT